MENFKIVRTGKIRDVYAIFVNEQRVRQKDLTVELDKKSLENGEHKFNIHGWFNENSKAKEELLNLKFSDLMKLGVKKVRFYRLKLLSVKDFPTLRDDISWIGPEICFGWHENVGDLDGNFVYVETELTDSYLDLSSWDRKYSLNQYKEEFTKQMKNYCDNFLFAGDFLSTRYYRHFDLVIIIEDLEETIGEFFNRNKNILAESHEKTLKTIEENILKENSIKEFKFPADVRVVCEQYLHYFVDFLKDVGVKATANIEHDKLGRTLFKVIPENPKIALETIREALEIYLELPMSPLIDEDGISDSKVLSLRAEINTLKSRLDLAQIKQLETEKREDLYRELLQEKDNRIQTLEKSNRENFEPSIIRESSIEMNYIDGEILEETEKEKITEISNKDIDLGLVTVKQAKIGLGVEANTPRLTRLGIKKGKQLFDYLDKKFNTEENS